MDRQQKPAACNPNPKWQAVGFLTILSIAFLLYASTLGHGFIFSWDDFEYVVNNRDIHLGKSREAISAITTYNNLKSKHGPLRGWDGLGS